MIYLGIIFAAFFLDFSLTKIARALLLIATAIAESQPKEVQEKIQAHWNTISKE